MRTKYDQLMKALLTALLGRVARVEAELEIPGHAQTADLWVEPDVGHLAELRECGLLGRMVELGPCIIEAFSQPPGERDIRSCVREQYSLDHLRYAKAKAEKAAKPAFPKLWVISARVRSVPLGDRPPAAREPGDVVSAAPGPWADAAPRIAGSGGSGRRRFMDRGRGEAGSYCVPRRVLGRSNGGRYADPARDRGRLQGVEAPGSGGRCRGG